MARALVAILVTATLAAAAPARAGQVVFSREVKEGSTQLWAMNDSGGGERLLVDNVGLGLNHLREASVSADGATIAFSGTTLANVTTFDGQVHYGYWATGLYLWRTGQVKRVTPAPGPCYNCSTFETEPSVGPDGRTLSGESYFSTAAVGNFGRLLLRPAGGGDATIFDTNCQETEVGDPAIAPTGALKAAYVGCDDDAGRPQIVVSGPGRAGEHAAHVVEGRGDFAPETRRPAWSPDGSRLVAVDRPGDETTEVWTFRPDGGEARRILTAPAGTTIRNVVFLGPGRLLFDAHEGEPSDLWTVALSCDSCAFPAGAARLTTGGSSFDPAWTPADKLAQPGGTPPPGGPGNPPPTKPVSPVSKVTAVRGKAAPRRGIAVRIKLKRDATVRLTVRRGKRKLGTIRRKLEKGTRTVRVRRVGKRRLKRGVTYKVTVTVRGFDKRSTLRVRAR